MNWRRHQLDMLSICEDILSGQKVSYIVAHVTPGGGKSFLSVILASRLIPTIASRICIVVPRLTLEEQTVRAFMAHGIEVMETRSGNRVNPCRGTIGYVTTYQAVAADPGLHRREFDRHPYLLVLDEPHHVEKGSVWETSLQPMVERAKLTTFMSGTMERGDGGLIAFVHDQLPDRRDIRYTRSDALKEGAIKPLQFVYLDGRAEWDDEGDPMSVESLASAGEERSSALFTALRTEYAADLLKRCVADWLAYRSEWKTAKLLVVSPDIETAKVHLDHLKSIGVRRCDIATSDDTRAARDNIRDFRNSPKLDALVTVAMAYEGMDAPDVTHIACLTHIRSKPWVEQMAARACRAQSGVPRGYVYGPDDRLLRSVFEEIEGDQTRIPRVSDRSPIPPSGVVPFQGITPIESSATSIRVVDLAPTPFDRELTTRQAIDEHIRWFCVQHQREVRYVNGKLRQIFDKPRADMTEVELLSVLAWLRDKCPLREPAA